MGFKILIILLILIPTLIAAFILAMTWILKHNPAVVLEYQSLFIDGGIICVIILLIPLLISVVAWVITMWSKFKKEK